MNAFSEKMFRENFIKIATIIAFTPGVGCFLIYYSHISYMPKITFSSVVAFLFFVSMTSALTVFIMGFGLVMPGFIWQVSLENRYIKKLFLSRGKILKSKYRKVGQKLVYVRRVIGWVAIPNVLLLISFLVWFFKSKELGYLLAFLTGALMFVVCRVRWERHWRAFWVLGRSSLFSFVFVFLSVLVFLSFLLKTGDRLTGGDLALLVMAVLIVIEANVGVAIIPEIRKGKRVFRTTIVFSIIVFLILTMLMGRINYIPARMMQIYKMGNFEADQVLFDERGCEIYFTYAGLGTPRFEFERMCAVSNLKILSSLGDEWYFEMNDGKHRFTVASEHVLSWGIDK